MRKFFAFLSGALGIGLGVSLLFDFIGNGGTLMLQARAQPEAVGFMPMVTLFLIVAALVGNFVVYIRHRPYTSMKTVKVGDWTTTTIYKKED